MAKIQTAGSFELQGLHEQIANLKKIMSDDPTFHKKVNNAIRRVLKDARKKVSQDGRGILENDPRQAYKAIRTTVYRKLLGGNINILSRRKAGKPGNYQKPKKGLPRRGGNRWGISSRTIAMDGYQGMDRGFILRFSQGTVDRAIHSYTGKDGERHDLGSGSVSHLILNKRGKIVGHAIGGNRGRIKGSQWFGSSSQNALEQAIGSLQDFIDEIIRQELV